MKVTFGEEYVDFPVSWYKELTNNELMVAISIVALKSNGIDTIRSNILPLSRCCHRTFVKAIEGLKKKGLVVEGEPVMVSGNLTTTYELVKGGEQ